MKTLTQTPRASRLLAGTSAQFEAECGRALDAAKSSIASLKALPKGSGDQALSLYDDATTELSNIASRCSLGHEVHPDAAFRKVAESCEQRIEAYAIALAQDRGVYDALSAAQTDKLDAVSALWLSRTLRVLGMLLPSSQYAILGSKHGHPYERMENLKRNSRCRAAGVQAP